MFFSMLSGAQTGQPQADQGLAQAVVWSSLREKCVVF
jgi:hypothetical protein